MAATLKCTRLLVALLACLAAPEGPRPRTRATVSEPNTDAAETVKQEVRSCSVFAVKGNCSHVALQAQYPRCPPYVGYRRDLIATLASLSHGNADVVREIVSAGKHGTLLARLRTTNLYLMLGPSVLG